MKDLERKLSRRQELNDKVSRTLKVEAVEESHYEYLHSLFLKAKTSHCFYTSYKLR